MKINLTGDKYAQNAYWTNHLNFILLGNGGSERSNYANSPSIIGHEFGHAIVYYSSGLKYESQSGALNEHFGDIMGVNLEAYVTGNPFDYTIGDEIITASASEGHRFMVDYILSSNAYTPQQAERYHLRKVALRNLYEPAISIYPQPKDMETANQLYGPLCQPSVDNDYCGVHYASGIPNRAAAMIIDTLGMERTRSLFFNTVTRRLGPNSNFQEYRRQLHEECLQAGDFNQNECAVILASFEKVGVGAAVKPPPPPPPPPPQTKALKYCGWLSVSATKNITVIDNKFDSVVLNVANKDKFGGVYTPISTNELNTLLGMHKGCGCVKGVLSQVQNSKGTWFNYLVLAHTVEKLATATCKNIEFK